ncbi:hypothetical protein V5799_022954 [Amblyomma americanum]|uniref:Uncharacterized protein n=1 Tax=Amblyomma americanum TaxID=6943 RepID=A0AAQ4FJ18_AMBAM
MIEDKNKLFALFLKTRKPSILAEFKKLRNRITSELRKAKVQYFQQLIQDASTSRPDRIWKIVNDALGLRTAAPNQFQMTVQGDLRQHQGPRPAAATRRGPCGPRGEGAATLVYYGGRRADAVCVHPEPGPSLLGCT